ncbi:MAG: peptidase [Candidatus Taylorbacteria bacterium]|nr:peptidase [Candidatus Taylorbacteria bacterium]
MNLCLHKMKSWNQKQIQQHKTAGEKLGIIKDEFRDFILEKKNVKKDLFEKDCVEFIKRSYKKHELVNDDKKEFAIVAFGKNTNQVHYFPKGKGLKLIPNTLILLDIWARLDQKMAPYADTTFMFHYGKKIPKEIQKTWEVLIKSRSNAIEYIESEIKKNQMPRGVDIDRVAHDHIGSNGYSDAIKHTIGHSLGFDSPHGKLPGINWREYSLILKNVGYTIEPGMYLKDFGMRTELDFYVNDKNEMLITTPIQKEIEII